MVQYQMLGDVNSISTFWFLKTLQTSAKNVNNVLARRKDLKSQCKEQDS